MKLFFSLLIATAYQAATFNYEFNVAKTTVSPDGVLVTKNTINGQIPGPAIIVPAASEIKVVVNNFLDHPITIHWHGITQKRTLLSDGVPYVTQDPIPSGGNYTYKFSVGSQTGTFWYHAHTRLDSASVFGALIIKEDPQSYKSLVLFDKNYRYEDERYLLLSDYWHEDSDIAYQKLTTPPFSVAGSPDAVLINGKSHIYNATIQEQNYTVLNVKPNSRYRLRIIGAQERSFYRFQIPDHKLTVIEADGTYVTPFDVDYLDVNSGTRYSVILETQATVSNYFIYAQIINEGNKVNNGIALLSYEGALNKLSDISPPINNAITTDSKLEEYLRISDWYKRPEVNLPFYYSVPLKSDEELIFSTKIEFANGRVLYKVNDVEHKERTSNLLKKIGANPQYQEPGVYNIKANGNAKQFILQQYTAPQVGCAEHPWHLHGHSFYIVGRGAGVYQPEIDGPKIDENIINHDGILRDTFTFIPQVDNTTVTSDTENSPCGWTAIRFIADNPGLWLMHCHITTHMTIGKQFVINAQVS